MSILAAPVAAAQAASQVVSELEENLDELEPKSEKTPSESGQKRVEEKIKTVLEETEKILAAFDEVLNTEAPSGYTSPIANNFGPGVSNPYQENTVVRDRLTGAYTRLAEAKARLFPLSSSYDALTRDLETLRRALEKTKNLVDQHVDSGQRASSWHVFQPEISSESKNYQTPSTSFTQTPNEKKIKPVYETLNQEIKKLNTLTEQIDTLIHDLQAKQKGSVLATVDQANVFSSSFVFNTGITSTFTDLPQIAPVFHLELGECARYGAYQTGVRGALCASITARKPLGALNPSTLPTLSGKFELSHTLLQHGVPQVVLGAGVMATDFSQSLQLGTTLLPRLHIASERFALGGTFHCKAGDCSKAESRTVNVNLTFHWPKGPYVSVEQTNIKQGFGNQPVNVTIGVSNGW